MELLAQVITFIIGIGAVSVIVAKVMNFIMVIKEVGDVANAIVTANADGKLTNDEIVKITEEFKHIAPAFKKAMESLKKK